MRGRRSWSTLVAAIALVALVGVVVVDDRPVGGDPVLSSRPERRPGPTRVLLVGDSIGDQYAMEAQDALADRGVEVSMWAVWGKGLLDADLRDGSWFASLVADVDPDVVVLENVGNYNSPEFGDPVADSPEFYAAWDDAVRRDVAIFGSAGATVVVVKGPKSAAEPFASRTPVINALYDQVPGVVLVDGWAALGGEVFDPDLHWADGVHLTEAGAARLADAVVATIDRVLQGGGSFTTGSG